MRANPPPQSSSGPPNAGTGSSAPDQPRA
jgi:hypothetical protein